LQRRHKADPDGPVYLAEEVELKQNATVCTELLAANVGTR